MMPCAAAGADDFQQDRLREGIEAAKAGNFALASDEFRIAAFGLLDQPPLYEEAIARLALAEDKDGRPADARASLRRFLEIENRFKAFAQSRLDAATKDAFRALLLREIPDALKLAPSLAPSSEEEAAQFSRLSPKERAAAFEKRATDEPRETRWPVARARVALEEGDPKGALAWAEKALAIDPAQTDALAIQGHVFALRGRCAAALPILQALPAASYQSWSDLAADRFVCAVDRKDWAGAREAETLVPSAATERKDVVRARAMLAERTRKDAEAAKSSTPPSPVPTPERPTSASPAAPEPAPAPPTDDLAEPRRLVAAGDPSGAEKPLKRLVKKDPKRREAHLALLEAACLAKDWKIAARELAASVPFSETEAPYTFYASVVSYETGKIDDARQYLARSKGRINESAYTRFYEERIESGR